MKLEDINKDNIFRVPDGYFEEFPEKLKKRIREQEEKREKETRVISMLRPYRMAIAASLVVVLSAFIYLLIGTRESPEDMLSEVPTEALVAYLEESDMSSDEMLENIDIDLITGEEYIEDLMHFPDEEDPDGEALDEILLEYELELDI